MRLSLAPVIGTMHFVCTPSLENTHKYQPMQAYFPSVAAHTQLLAPYYDDPDEFIAYLANPQSLDDDAL